MARVYLETSFFSAAVSSRTDTASVHRRDESRRWWVRQRILHELFVSAEVLRELASPNYAQREAALALATEARVLPIDEDVRGLARILVRE